MWGVYLSTTYGALYTFIKYKFARFTHESIVVRNILEIEMKS